MEINRRSFIGGGALAAAVGMAPSAGQGADSPAATAGGKGTIVGKRRFVGACPNANATIKRTPGPIRVMVIGAHPDDADNTGGGLTVKPIANGHKAKSAPSTDGRTGHPPPPPDETAKKRRAETIEAAKRFGLDGYDIYGYPDCGLIPSYEARCLVAKKIREYEPDFVVTHRTCDYHADHRATGQLVMDAGYLLGVPHWCEEAKAQRLRPVIFYMSDPFTYPRELRPDVMVDADPYLDKWCEGLDAQVSQFYEWLPWDRGREEDVVALGDRSDIAKRNAFLVRWTAGRKRADARRYADEWRSQHPGAQVPKHIEVYEVSEYGRAPTESDLRLFLGE